MVPRLLLAALLAAALARPQDDCEIFGCSEEPEEPEECDEIFGCDSEEEEPRTRTACFDEVNEIADQENERNVFNDCNPERKCEYYAAQGYACANSWNCNEDRKIITDGKGLIDVRQLDDVSLDLSDHKCDDRDKICCKRPNYRADPPEDPERTPIEDKDEPNVKREVEEFSQCGRNEKAHTSLTGGAADQAQLAEFPHMCVLYRMEGRQRVYVGGASLIARNKVITVAHKFNVIQDKNNPVDWRDRKREFMVRCGEYDVKVEDAFLPSQESRVEEIYFHPQYEPRTVKNNLAIVRTRENFLYQKHIGPICLPRPNESFEGRKGRDCWSSGWGADKFVGDATYSDGLRKVKLGVVGREECQRRMEATKRFRGKGFQLHASWLCIGGQNGTDTCKGDGGSPHICKTEKGWTQVGAVAWGIKCGTDVPAVYSSIAHAMCWIDWVMSCFGDSDENINSLFADAFDIRGSTDSPESINSLSEDDCRDWMDENVDLRDRCEVQYISIDERANN